MNNITFHYKNIFDDADAGAYVKTVNFYDRKIKSPALPIDFYFCDNFPEVMQISGIDYRSDYSGIRYDDLGSHENNSNLEINGRADEEHRFDPHDLWHERLRTVMDPAIINRPVDEGCAYLYGGSWGISWEDILTMFKKYAGENPGADWLKLHIESKNKNFSDGNKPLKISYAINALIVRKIEKEKGFAPVMQLLGCGKMEPGDENYFKALEQVSGIGKAEFNTAVWQLINGQD